MKTKKVVQTDNTEPQELVEEHLMFNKKKSDKPPVVSVYSLIRNDIWSAFHEYTNEFSVLAGLIRLDRDNTKEFHRGSARAIAFAVQFYYKVKNNFPETFNLIEQQDVDNPPYDVDKYGSPTQNYVELMKRIIYGTQNNKGGYDKFKPNYSHLAGLGDYMARFCYVSGVSDIEGRFSDEEKNEFGYGG